MLTFRVVAEEGERLITLAEMELNANGRAARLLTWARSAPVGAVYVGQIMGFIVERVS